ncbi:MAG TPA: hypothetical protein VF484_07445 [Candidatus Limnocylindrales bacterium]
MRVRDLLRLGLPAALVLSACSAAASSPSPTGPGSPAPSNPPASQPAPSPTAEGAATLLLRVTTEGGFIGPAANLAALPQVTVLSDGRILTPAPVDAIYPGPLVLPVSVRNVGPSGAAAILAAIRAAGLDTQLPAGGGIAADTGKTVFLVNVDGKQVTNRLVLGGGGPGRPGGGASPDPAAAAAADLLAKLADPGETWGAASAPDSPFVPVGFRVYVAPGAPVGDGSTTEPTIAWPLSTPLASFGVPAVPDRGIAGLRQGVVLGADAQALLPILNRSNVLTPFGSAGQVFTLYVRVLLPDEVPAQG